MPWLVTYGTLDPIAHIVRIFLSGYQTLGALCWIYFSLGGTFFALFLHARGRSTLAGFVGGLVFSGAFFWVGDGDYPLAFSLPLLASMLLIVARTTSKWMLAVLTACAVGYGWLAGHFNFVPIILVGVGVYVLAFHALQEKSIIAAFKAGLSYSAGVCIGTLIGLIKLVPALAYVGLSERQGGLSVAQASAGAWQPSFLLTAVFPYLRLPFTGGEIGGWFMGAMALGLFLTGLFSFTRNARPVIAAWTAVVLFVLPHSPLYWLIQHMPFFDVLRTPVRWLILGHAAAASLVAISFDSLHDRTWERIRKRIGTAFLGLGLCAILTSFFLTVLDFFFQQRIIQELQTFFDAHVYAKTSGLPLEHYHLLIGKLWDSTISMVSPLHITFLLPLLGLLLAGFALRAARIQKLSLQKQQFLFLVLVLFTLIPPFFFYHEKTHMSVLRDAASLYHDVIPPQNVVMPVMPAFSLYLLASDTTDPYEAALQKIAFLVPNTQALIGIHSIDTYQPLQPYRMGRLLAALGSDTAPAPPAERVVMQKIPISEKIALIHDRISLLALLNVQNIVSAWELPSPFVLQKKLPTVPPLTIYGVPQPRPLVFFSSRQIIHQPDQDHMIDVMTHLPDVSADFLECYSCESMKASADISDIHDDALSSSFTVSANAKSWVVLSRPRLPGWRVEVDGAPVKTAIANGIFFGIPVASGFHTVTAHITYASLWMDSLHFLLTKEDPWLL